LFDKSGGLVAHDFRSDMRMSDDLDFSDYERHDTQNVQAYCALNRNKPPGLSMLASDVLGVYLDRTDGHYSIDDARVTMQLWKYHVTGIVPTLATTSTSVSTATATTTSAPVPAGTATTTSTTATSKVSATRVQPDRSCKKPRMGLAPGHLVALPDNPGACPPDYEWDRKTLTYVPKVYSEEEEDVRFIPHWAPEKGMVHEANTRKETANEKNHWITEEVS
jgi:hypothetical protein